ncbi:MAG: branched-chain amino acid ABC transporter permease [Actinomycetota bacterium]|nr:branched-chain amino acid ABC transporter permease [Actinomycetota bacterium]
MNVPPPPRDLRTSRVLAAAAAVLIVAGVLMPWADFAGFPGKMTLAGYPGGARAYCLVLALGYLLVALPVPQRRRAGLATAVGLLVVTVQTAFAIAHDGGGLSHLAVGAWTTLLGAGAGLAAMVVHPDDTRPSRDSWPRLPAAVELGAVIGGLVGAFVLLVFSLTVDDGGQFVALSVTVAAVLLAWRALGAFDFLSEMYRRRHTATLLVMAVAALVFPFTQGGSSYWLRVGANIGVFAAAAIGLNIVVGLAGLLDLGYIAFFGIGAYVAALYGNAGLGPSRGHLPFLLIVVLGALVSGVIGVLIGAPTLRLRGDYLAIVTLGFGEIFRLLVNTYDTYTGGPNGLSNIPDLKAGAFDLGQPHVVFGVELAGFANYYFVELVLVVVFMFVFSRLNDSRIGRAWVAIREDELAAASMGINTVSMKLLAFGLGATLAGAAGTVQAHVATQVSPDSFIFLKSVLLLAAVVLGGMGTVPGAVVGSALLIAVPEKLRALGSYQLLIFGLALVIVMRFRPEGLIPSRRRQREFHESDGEADALSAPPGRDGH